MTLAENELCDIRSVSGNIPGAKRSGILIVSMAEAWKVQPQLSICRPGLRRSKAGKFLIWQL